MLVHGKGGGSLGDQCKSLVDSQATFLALQRIIVPFHI